MARGFRQASTGNAYKALCEAFVRNLANHRLNWYDLREI